MGNEKTVDDALALAIAKGETEAKSEALEALAVELEVQSCEQTDESRSLFADVKRPNSSFRVVLGASRTNGAPFPPPLLYCPIAQFTADDLAEFIVVARSLFAAYARRWPQ